MKIEQAHGCIPQFADRFPQRVEAGVQPTSTDKATTASSTVFISGQTLLRQRLFMSAPDVEPPMITDKKLMNLNFPLPHYLRTEDRALLGEIYEFAQSENIDLRYVDRYGMELAQYRTSDNGRQMIPQSRGPIYDLEGHRLSYSFTAADAEHAKRIRNSASLETTRLDKGFILYDTDEDYSALGHSLFEFLELLVDRFSSSKDPVPVNGRFTQYTSYDDEYIVHKSSDVQVRVPSASSGKKDSAAQNMADKQRPDSLTSTLDLRTTLRQIMHKYLVQSGLPTLFDTLRRLGK
jgi:hypothetical protein